MYEYAVILSGPEPQRSILESILLKELKDASEKILFIRGVMSDEGFQCDNPNINMKNHLFGKALQEALNCSRVIISRSGYSTIMDLAALGKKAFFIPTPGQYEQEYLAEKFQDNGIAPYCDQNHFSLEQLQKVQNYKGLSDLGGSAGLRGCLAFFHSK